MDITPDVIGIIDTIVEVVAAVGAMLTTAAAGVQAAMVGTAILLTMSSGGFRASDTRFWMWTWTSVKPL